MHPGKRVMLLWDPAGQSCRGRVDNSLEDGSLSFRVSSRNFAQQEVGFCNEVRDIFKMTETLWTLEDLVKNWFLFISAECSFRLFYKLTCVSAAPTTQGRTAESQPKDLNSFWRVDSVSCSNRNVRSSAETWARWSCLIKWEMAGMFKTSNPLIIRQNKTYQALEFFLLFFRVTLR